MRLAKSLIISRYLKRKSLRLIKIRLKLNRSSRKKLQLLNSRVIELLELEIIRELRVKEIRVLS
jgi:hypothetical protein